MSDYILYLGASESGKSTFIRQIRIIHGQHFAPNEILEFKNIIYQNILFGFRTLLLSVSSLGLMLNENSTRIADEFLNRIGGLNQGNTISSVDFASQSVLIKKLCQDPAIDTVLTNRYLNVGNDSLDYYINNLERIAKHDYHPVIQDILFCRKPTSRVDEYEIEISNQILMFIDVGGQRSQRSKWIQCFNDVKAILFMSSSSEFDETLNEDKSTNRLQESLDIFKTLVQNKWLQMISIILFLNKTDLLEQKIKNSRISDYFRNFHGDPKCLRDVQEFICKMFVTLRLNKDKPFYHYFTTITDTEKTRFVFKAVKDMILKENVAKIMLE